VKYNFSTEITVPTHTLGTNQCYQNEDRNMDCKILLQKDKIIHKDMHVIKMTGKKNILLMITMN